MPFSDIESKKQELIRKALGGGALLAPIATPALAALTEDTGAGVIDLAIPPEYRDLGYMPDDGISHSVETSQSDITSWQSVSPTRSDTTSETWQVTVVLQETKKESIALYYGAHLAALVADATTGEVVLDLPETPSSRAYRLLTLAVDKDQEGDEIYIARLFPNAKVVGKAEQVFGKGDQAIGWGLTFQGFKDSTLGTAQRTFFGGPGWQKLLTPMGFTSGS